nr:MAG TPA: hypothetical protein [Caudoviricetes sp.]
MPRDPLTEAVISPTDGYSQRFIFSRLCPLSTDRGGTFRKAQNAPRL